MVVFQDSKMRYPFDFRSRLRCSRGRGKGVIIVFDRFDILCCPVRLCRVFRFLETIKVTCAEPDQKLKFEAH